MQLQSRYHGKTYHNALLTAIGPYLGYGPMLKRWLLGKEERASPSRLVGPKRFFAPPLPLDKLPELVAIILSHDHCDHFDEAAIRALGRTGVPFFCPLGVGMHLRRWGCPPPASPN